MPGRPPELCLHEEIVLLALNDTRGTLDRRAAMYGYALGGALVAELLLAGRITLRPEKRKTLVDVAETRPLNEPVLDDCLMRIRNARRPGTLAAWVGTLAQKSSDLRRRIALGLCDRGVLRETEETVLLFFTRRRYPEQDHRFEERLLERMRAAVRGEGPVDVRTAVIVALADAAKLLPMVLEKPELKARRTRIEQIAAGAAVGEGVRAAVKAAHQAAMTAASVAACAAIAAASG